MTTITSLDSCQIPIADTDLPRISVSIGKKRLYMLNVCHASPDCCISVEDAQDTP